MGEIKKVADTKVAWGMGTLGEANRIKYQLKAIILDTKDAGCLFSRS